MVLMAIVPGMALEGVGGLMGAMVAGEVEVGMAVLEGMEEVEERGQWGELEVLVEMVLMQTVPGMVLEAAMETKKRLVRSKEGRGMKTVWEIETGRALEERAQRSNVHKLWAPRDGLCRHG